MIDCRRSPQYRIHLWKIFTVQFEKSCLQAAVSGRMH